MIWRKLQKCKFEKRRRSKRVGRKTTQTSAKFKRKASGSLEDPDDLEMDDRPETSVAQGSHMKETFPQKAERANLPVLCASDHTSVRKINSRMKGSK